MVAALLERPAACKMPQGWAPGRPWRCGPQAGWANQKQHSTWDRYTHISLTLSQVTQSRTERNKNKELVSPQRRREQAPQAPAGGDTRWTGRWTHDSPPWKVSCYVRTFVCVCVCVSRRVRMRRQTAGRESSGNLYLGCPGSSSGEGVPA